MRKKFPKFIVYTLTLGGIFFFLSTYAQTGAAAVNDSPSYIDVTTIEETGDTVEGNPIITAVPNPSKEVDNVIFSAKAINEPESAYYPYAPISSSPYSWSWPTGDPWVPDGKYILKMDITYATGELETITREIHVDNYTEPNAPDSPKDMSVTTRTNSSVELTWSPSTSTKLYNYEIYQNGEKIGETDETFLVVDSLTPETRYEFRVKAKDIYNNLSIDDNTIAVITHSENGGINSLPFTSEIQAPEANGVTPGIEGYSGTVELSVTAVDPSVDNVVFSLKAYDAPESEYWDFPATNVDGDTYSIDWDTTSAPEGNVIVKAVASDIHGQATTITHVLLVDNVIEGYVPPNWEPADTPPANYVIAYLAGWATLGNFDIMRDLDASRLTHINYAFGLIGDDLSLQMSDPVNDPINFEELAKLKEKYPHLKTTIAIGGWGGSANFSEAAATEESRNIFADSVVAFIVEHGFDGVDLDWEYPVTGGGPGTYPNPDDRENYPLLLETLREKLDEQGEIDGVHYTLSIAGAANTGFVENTQLGLSQEYLDYVQIMTYDIHGTWEGLADFNAPLFDDNGKTWSVDKAVDAYLEAGVPADKVVMGVPFYGYTYNVTSSENNGLRQPFAGSGSVTYNRIVQDDYLNNGYVRYWDEGSQVPYLFNEEESTFISYDDEESMTKKAEYIREKGLGGAMIWEISQDHGIDLLDSLYTVLKEPIDPSLKEATISVDNNVILQDEKLTVNLVTTLTNGEELDLTEADVEWLTTNTDVVTVIDGELTAMNAGNAEIYATISYKDQEVTTNAITIKVEVSPSSLSKQLNNLKENGDIEHSLYKKLSNQLKQVDHHYQKGNTKQALKHLENFNKHLEKSKTEESIKTTLKGNSDAIKEFLLK